jgi:hypothetical protein
MHSVRRKLAAPEEFAEKSRVVSPTRGARDDALSLIFAPLKSGDGFRHGALGAPGYGKTTHIRAVLAAALERGHVDLVLTHDVKSAEPEFEGIYLRSAADSPDAAELERRRHVVYRGDPRADIDCPAEDVAALGRRLARDGSRVLLNVGELGPCLTEGGRSWEAPSVLWFSAQGRKLKGCLTWTQQQPKRCPDEIFDQSTTIAFLHHNERSANYLSNTLMLDPAMVSILPRLGKFELVIWRPELEWDGKVYPFPPA